MLQGGQLNQGAMQNHFLHKAAEGDLCNKAKKVL
jgi:hypothetical protein